MVRVNEPLFTNLKVTSFENSRITRYSREWIWRSFVC